MVESKTIFGLIVYKDGTIKNAKSGKKVGYVSTSGELCTYVPEKRLTYKTSIIMIAVWLNNGVFPEKPKTWKIIYKDGDNMNCSLDNLDYIDTSKDTYKFVGNELKNKIKELKIEKKELFKQIKEIDNQILKFTSELASTNKVYKYTKTDALREEFNSKRAPKITYKKDAKPRGRKPGSGGVYLIDKFSQDYEFITVANASKKLGVSEGFINGLAAKSSIVHSNPRYALTRNFGNVWDLMGETE